MKNKTKTILFASLIVAMIIPVSGMNTAAAVETSDEKKQQLLDLLVKVEERLEMTTSETAKEKLESKKQLILAQLFKEVGTENLTQAKIGEESKTSLTASATSELFNMYGVHTGCDFGIQIFNLKANYASGSTMLSIEQDFPYELTSGFSPYCEEHDWIDNVFLNIANVWDGSGCVSNLDVDPKDSYPLNCGVVLGGVYVVQVAADYDGKQMSSYTYFWA